MTAKLTAKTSKRFSEPFAPTGASRVVKQVPGIRKSGLPRYRERTVAMVADTARGSLRYSRLLRLVNDGDAAPAEEESALVPILPTYAVVDPFAGPQHLKDVALTGGPPSPLRLDNHPISDLALNHRRTSLNSIVFESMVPSRYGVERKRMTASVLELWAKWGGYVGPARPPDTPDG